jgi:hypothetical protein
MTSRREEVLHIYPPGLVYIIYLIRTSFYELFTPLLRCWRAGLAEALLT